MVVNEVKKICNAKFHKAKIPIQIFLIHFEVEWHMWPGLMGVVAKVSF
jgi:hypothetical protein